MNPKRTILTPMRAGLLLVIFSLTTIPYVAEAAGEGSRRKGEAIKENAEVTPQPSPETSPTSDSTPLTTNTLNTDAPTTSQLEGVTPPPGDPNMPPMHPNAPPIDPNAPPPKPDPTDLNTTIPLTLQNAGIDQIIQFLGESTGKPVIKGKNTEQAMISVTSPVPIARGRALELIYDALLMQDVYVIETDDQIRIINSAELKGFQLPTIGVTENVQELPDSSRLAQKIYKIQNLSVEDLKSQLARFIPETVLATDARANTLVVTDRINRLKYYDRLINTLESAMAEGRETEIFKLQHTDAEKLTTMLNQILAQSSSTGSQSAPGGGGPRWGGGGNRWGGGSDTNASSIGGVFILPETTLNWLIVSCPKARLEEIRKLVKDFDQPQDLDVQARMLDVKHIEVTALKSMVDQVFRTSNNSRAEKDQVRTVATDDGKKLVVYSTMKSFEQVKALAASLDTPDAEKRETRNFVLKHIKAQDLVTQLTELWESQSSSSNNMPPWYWGGYDSRSSSDVTKPSFVASPRTNTLMVMARPKDFPFIEDMIEQLDVEVDVSLFQPRIYNIRHTDASELVRVLEKLFQSSTSSNDMWYWRSSSNEKKPFEGMFGEIRFVVDNVTNRVVALSSNPKDYDIIDRMVEQLDKVDPESTEVLVYDLKHANPLDVAERLNNLFSEGSVQRQQTAQSSDTESTEDPDIRAMREMLFPWQSGGQTNKTNESRPINTMVGNIRVVPDRRSNAVICAAPSIYFTSLRNVLEQLDQPEPKVYIKARIVEVYRGKERHVGVRWFPDPNSIDPSEVDGALLGLGQIGMLDVIGGSDAISSIETAFTTRYGKEMGFKLSEVQGNSVLAGSVNLGLLIQLMEKNSESRTVSEQAVAVNNNQKGDIFYGSEYPFKTGSIAADTGSVTDSVEYKKVGIQLEITPHINKNKQVVLKASVENSSIRPELVNGELVKDMHTFATELAIDSDQTMVIGGIKLQEDSNIKRATPFLSSIPIVKYLFSKKDRTGSSRELVFFITPTVLENRKDDDKLYHEAQLWVEEINRNFEFEGDQKKPKDQLNNLDPQTREQLMKDLRREMDAEAVLHEEIRKRYEQSAENDLIIEDSNGNGTLHPIPLDIEDEVLPGIP